MVPISDINPTAASLNLTQFLLAYTAKLEGLVEFTAIFPLGRRLGSVKTLGRSGPLANR